MTRSATPQGTTPAIDGRTWRMCWVIAMGAFTSGLDAAVVNLGLDSISRHLHASLGLTQWVVTGYLVAMAVSLPPASWLTRRYGSGRIWMAALAAFTIASGLCAMAPSVAWLIAARVLQGLAGGILIPAGQTVLGEAVGPDRLGRVMGVLGLAVSAAPAVGPLLGGVILRIASWPWLFLVNLPIGTLALLLAWRLVPRSRGGLTPPPHWLSMALISAALPLLVWSTAHWGQAKHPTVATLTTAGCAAAAIAGFVRVSLHTRHPALQVRLFALAGFRAAALAALTSGALVFGSGIAAALYFQLGRGQDQLHAGFSLAGMALATAAVGPAAGRWIDRIGPGPVALSGGLLAAAALTPLTVGDTDTPTVLVQASLVVFGAAVSLSAMPVTVAAFRSVEHHQLPDAVTLINILQRIGGALAGAICTVLIATDTSNAGFHHAFTTLTLFALLTGLGGWLVLRSTPDRGGENSATADGPTTPSETR